MFPDNENNDYPSFEANQLLTAESLNNSFEYLDEQERLTRANLLGIGIVCGLNVRIDTTGGYGIIISKGCGITSEGYLVVHDNIVKDNNGNIVLDSSGNPIERKFTHYKEYRSLEANDNFHLELYNLFCNPDGTQKYRLDELVTSSEGGATLLNADPTFMNDKVVMAFVEKKIINNRNCDTGSCDDKGENVEINIRFLLINSEDANDLITRSNNDLTIQYDTPLQTLKIDRIIQYGTYQFYWDIQGGKVNIYSSYKTICNTLPGIFKSFLTAAYNKFRAYLTNDFQQNPFRNFENIFSFLENDNVTRIQIIHIQYFYDFLSDLTSAYEEIRNLEVLTHCCPDNGLFPRHLFLGWVTAQSIGVLDFRNRFIYSPLLERMNLQAEVRSLFKRIDVMIRNFIFNDRDHDRQYMQNIYITSSKIGDVPLSKKAIPYYYKVIMDGLGLINFWDYRKFIRNEQFRNLSYYSALYDTLNDTVRNALKYDIESYNFFRIEGHIGKTRDEAVRDIQSIRDNKNLPFEIIALSTSEFPTYFNSHPGMEHKAGVPGGGTFILVSNNVDFTVNGITIGANTVIADFYIPYICCDDERAIFYISPRTFCSNDSRSYEFLTLPPPTTDIRSDRVFNSNGLIMHFNSGVVSFIPSDQNLEITKTYSLVYMGITLNITINHGNADFQYRKKIVNGTNVLLEVRALQNGATRYSWNISRIDENNIRTPLIFSQSTDNNISLPVDPNSKGDFLIELEINLSGCIFIQSFKLTDDTFSKLEVEKWFNIKK